jgi:uncharacterized protein
MMDTQSMNLEGISYKVTNDKVFLVAHPVLNRPNISGDTLRSLLVSQGYGDCVFDEVAINKAAEMCNIQQGVFELAVAQRLDATIAVSVGPDDMAATLSITSAHGGKVASVPDVMAALNRAGVTCGIDADAIERVCQQGSCTDCEVARAVLPQRGGPAVLQTMIEQTVDRQPQLDAQGLIDYREHSAIAVVHPGDALMRRIPPAPGINGQTVKGKNLPAIAGQDAVFAASLNGVHISSDDPNLLLATVSGQPVRVKGGVMVEPVLLLKEVNMATGNIHFDGTVHVLGEVIQGMKIQASGDIVVDGLVDGGHLQAGGSIFIAGGVIAHAKLHAASSVHARFAESSQITAGTVIAIDNMVIDCIMHSLNHIIIGANASARARLVGGVATAAMLLQVPWLGSAKSGTTRIVLGDNTDLDAKYVALQRRIVEEKTNEANLNKLIKQLTSTGDPKGMLGRVKASRQHTMQVWGQLLVEEVELKKELALPLTAKLQATAGVEGSVELSFGKLTVRLRQDFGAGTFSVDPQMGVIFTGRNGQSVPLA